MTTPGYEESIDPDDDGGKLLVIHARDLMTPFGSTVPFYLTRHLADDHMVHIVCRRRPVERTGDVNPADVVYHDLYTGDVPVVSGLLFLLVSTVYTAVLGLRHRYDVVYGYQDTIVQAWVGSTIGRSKFIIGLQSVPVGQYRNLVGAYGRAPMLEQVELTIALRLLTIYKHAIRYMLGRATTIVCLTDEIKVVTERRIDVTLPRSIVIGMGVDIARFGRDPPARDARPKTWSMTYLGTVHATRQLDHVIEAIARIDADIEFRIAGGGAQGTIRRLEELARELGVEDQVKWLGLIPHAEVPELLHSTDITVSPLADIESYQVSFPAKLLEYLAAGTLVVATDIQPHRELIEDGRNGYLYADGPDGFYERLVECLQDTANHAAIRRAAIRTARAYDWDEIIQRHEAVMFDGTSRESTARLDGEEIRTTA